MHSFQNVALHICHKCRSVGLHDNQTTFPVNSRYDTPGIFIKSVFIQLLISK